MNASERNEIYKKALKNGVTFEGKCTDLPNKEEWDKLMEGNEPADKKEVEKLLVTLGFLNQEDMSLHNPYLPRMTKTHIIYVHSRIEHFYRIK